MSKKFSPQKKWKTRKRNEKQLVSKKEIKKELDCLRLELRKI